MQGHSKPHEGRRMKNIVLIGMPGSGKTTIGTLLSKKLNMKFIDMDEFIESTENKSISHMFEIGEEYFRNAESKSAKILGSESSLIIAAGGGVIKRKENIDYFKKNSIIVFINRPVDKIMEDIEIDTRPLLKEGKDRIYTLYDERLPLYKQYCDVEVLNDKSLNDAVNKIIDTLKA